MENFQQDLDIPNSESNTETEFSRQVEECQSNLYRIEKLFFDLQRDSQKILRKSQDSLAKSFISNKKKRSKSLDEQSPVQEVCAKTHTKDHFCSNNNIEIKPDTPGTAEGGLNNNNNISPLTFVVQVPGSIVDDFKKNLSSSDLLNFLSQCSSNQSFKIKKKKGISLLFQNLFKRKKKDAPPSLNDLLLKNIKFIKFLSETSPNDAKFDQRSNESNIDQTRSKTNFQIENATTENLSGTNKSITDNNSSDGQALVFPINFNSNTNIHEPVKSNLVIQHEITPKHNLNQCTHTIKIINEPQPSCQSCHSQCSSKIIAEKQDSEEKELEKSSLNKLQSENNLMKSFIENLLKSTKNLNNLEILKIFVEILHEEKLKKKTPCCMDYSDTKMSNNNESNFLHNFLQQLMVELQNKTKYSEKNIEKTPRTQSSKISICPSTGGLSSEDESLEKPVVLKSKRLHKSTRRCQSPSMLRYRFCQSEKDFDKTVNANK